MRLFTKPSGVYSGVLLTLPFDLFAAVAVVPDRAEFTLQIRQVWNIEECIMDTADFTLKIRKILSQEQIATTEAADDFKIRKTNAEELKVRKQITTDLER